MLVRTYVSESIVGLVSGSDESWILLDSGAAACPST